MRILLGTTNPSKVKRFSDLLKGYDVEFVTLKDLAITDEPEENGTTPIRSLLIRLEVKCQPIIWMELQSIIMELSIPLWMQMRLRRQAPFIFC